MYAGHCRLLFAPRALATDRVNQTSEELDRLHRRARTPQTGPPTQRAQQRLSVTRDAQDKLGQRFGLFGLRALPLLCGKAGNHNTCHN
jgi:hypothetical protein